MFEIAMSVRPLARAWMFSSATPLGGPPRTPWSMWPKASTAGRMLTSWNSMPRLSARSRESPTEP